MIREMFSFICIVHSLLIPMGLGQTRKPLNREDDIGQLGTVWQYLHYEEPEFNETAGLTTDYFTDDYAGFYTKNNRPLSFMWDFVQDGEIPYAGMIIGEKKASGCGATLLTKTLLMTPCACVRGLILMHNNVRPSKGRQFVDPLDQGLKIYVVMNGIEYREDLAAKNFYPEIIGFKNASSCGVQVVFDNYWTTPPAIMEFSPGVDSGVAVPWPPSSFVYDGGKMRGGSGNSEFYTMAENSSLPEVSVVSFGFKSLDAGVKTYDNFGKEIKPEGRLIEARVNVADQVKCENSAFLKSVATYLRRVRREEELSYMICSWDEPDPPSERTYLQWKDASIRHYVKSVYQGLVGAPVTHKGQLLGWLVETLDKTSPGQRRTQIFRGIDDKLIQYINSAVRELRAGNRPVVHDRIRPQFAIHDVKPFLPDPDLQQEDVDVLEWSLVGESPYIRERSGGELVLPGTKFLLGVSIASILQSNL